MTLDIPLRYQGLRLIPEGGLASFHASYFASVPTITESLTCGHIKNLLFFHPPLFFRWIRVRALSSMVFAASSSRAP